MVGYIYLSSLEVSFHYELLNMDSLCEYHPLVPSDL